MQNSLADANYLLKLAKTKMPFGKYKGSNLINLPETYVIWFIQKGVPKGELGDMIKAIYEIKLNGLEYLIRPLI